MKKNTVIFFLTLLITFYFHTNATADDIFPDHNGTFINDFANLIDQKDENIIKSLCADIFKDELAVIVVCTIESLPKVKKEYNDPLLYGTDLFNYWGIGRKGINDGLLILISKGDSKAAICTGYLIEYYLPDPDADIVLKSYMFPHFKQGNYGKGIIEGIIEARKVMEKNRRLLSHEKNGERK